MMNWAILIVIINLIFFGAIAYYFLNVRITMREEQKDEAEKQKRLDEKIEKEEEKIAEELSNAKDKATAIIEESEKIAEELIVELENSLGQKEGSLHVNLVVGNDFEIKLGELSSKLKRLYSKRIHSLLSALENFQVDEAQKFTAFEEQQEEMTDRNLQQVRVEELEKMHKRIEQYKEEELALFDQKVKKLIEEAAQDVLGQALTSQEQELLIEKALAKAKEEGVI